MDAASEQARLKRQARWFRIMSTFAIGLALVCAGTQVVVAAAPLWKGGDARQALFDVSLQLVLAVPSLFYVVGLHRARQVFNRIGGGELLTLQNAKGLTGVGMCVLAGWVVVVAGLRWPGAAIPWPDGGVARPDQPGGARPHAGRARARHRDDRPAAGRGGPAEDRERQLPLMAIPL